MCAPSQVRVCDDPMAALLGLAALRGATDSTRAQGPLAFQRAVAASYRFWQAVGEHATATRSRVQAASYFQTLSLDHAAGAATTNRSMVSSSCNMVSV